MGFLVSICIAAVCIALYKLLVPENKFSGQISFLCVCVFLLTGINAVSGVEIDLSADAYELGVDENYIEFSQITEEQARKRVGTEMREKIAAILTEHEIFPDEIHVIINISGLYGIDISQVKLVFSARSSGGAGEQAAAKAAADVLSRELPEDIKIVTEVR